MAAPIMLNNIKSIGATFNNLNIMILTNPTKHRPLHKCNQFTLDALQTGMCPRQMDLSKNEVDRGFSFETALLYRMRKVIGHLKSGLKNTPINNGFKL